MPETRIHRNGPIRIPADELDSIIAALTCAIEAVMPSVNISANISSPNCYLEREDNIRLVSALERVQEGLLVSSSQAGSLTINTANGGIVSAIFHWGMPRAIPISNDDVVLVPKVLPALNPIPVKENTAVVKVKEEIDVSKNKKVHAIESNNKDNMIAETKNVDDESLPNTTKETDLVNNEEDDESEKDGSGFVEDNKSESIISEAESSFDSYYGGGLTQEAYIPVESPSPIRTVRRSGRNRNKNN